MALVEREPLRPLPSAERVPAPSRPAGSTEAMPAPSGNALPAPSASALPTPSALPLPKSKPRPKATSDSSLLPPAPQKKTAPSKANAFDFSSEPAQSAK